MSKTEGWKMLMSEQLREVISLYGHLIVIRKAIPGYHCPCWDDASESPDPDCMLCLGSGGLYVDHMVYGRAYTPRPGVGQERRALLGTIHSYAPVYIVEPDIVQPNTSSYVLELVLDPETMEPIRPYQIRVAFKITHVDELRDLNGELAFFSITAEEKVWEL